MKYQKTNCDTFLKLYRDIIEEGVTLNIRGSECCEILNYQFTIDPQYPLTSFIDRKLNLAYCKAETLWYIRGNRYDTSICDIAGTWQNLIQPDGGLNSNYGQVIFTGPRQIDWVVEELKRDRFSRRAIIVLGDHRLITKENTDHRCTMYICYNIRYNKLNQIVHMRSNDAVFGVTNDVFFFGILQQIVYRYLKSWYLDLEIGTYTHIVDSMHIYKRHYEMVKNILKNKLWYVEQIPKIETINEVDFLRYCQGRKIPDFYKFARWLMDK